MRKWSIALIPAAALAGLALVILTRPGTDSRANAGTPDRPARPDSPTTLPLHATPTGTAALPPPPATTDVVREHRIRRWIDVRSAELLACIELPGTQNADIVKLFREERLAIDAIERAGDAWALEQATAGIPPARAGEEARKRVAAETRQAKRATAKQVAQFLTPAQLAEIRAKLPPGCDDPFQD